MTEAERIRDYLQRSNLLLVRKEDAARLMYLRPVQLGLRLKAQGTTWRELKQQEQIRRLGIVLNGPGKVNIRKAAALCGFTYSESFLEFFKRVQGQSFTEWRMARQQW